MTDILDELELAALRSGRDEYSNLKLPVLAILRPQEATQIAERLPITLEQAAAIRWVLRGLGVDAAVAKVEVDRQMVERIRNKRRTEKELREVIG